MRKVIIAALLAAGPALSAEMVAKNGEDSITLQDRPCVHAGTLAQLKPEYRERFRMGRAKLQGQDWFLCWIVTPQSSIAIVFEDGDTLDLPMAVFKLDPGA